MNTPNKITIVRILLIPIIVALYLLSTLEGLAYFKLISLGILILAEATDFLDGYLARKNNQVTSLGKFLDPIADKVLTMASLLLVVVDLTIPAPYGVIIAIIILGRELIISAFRQIAATKNFVMAADKWGKLKTIFQDIALPCLFFVAYLNQIAKVNVYVDIFTIASYVLISFATLLTILSGVNYIVKNRNVLK